MDGKVAQEASARQESDTALYLEIQGKADDSGVVHTTGAETVGGLKTFSAAVALNTSGTIAANNHQAVDGDTVKAYVDSHITDIVITLD